MDSRRLETPGRSFPGHPSLIFNRPNTFVRSGSPPKTPCREPRGPTPFLKRGSRDIVALDIRPGQKSIMVTATSLAKTVFTFFCAVKRLVSFSSNSLCQERPCADTKPSASTPDADTHRLTFMFVFSSRSSPLERFILSCKFYIVSYPPK